MNRGRCTSMISAWTCPPRRASSLSMVPTSPSMVGISLHADVMRQFPVGRAVEHRRVSWPLVAAFAMGSSPAMAQSGSPDALVQALVTTAQQNFWGRAVLSNGETVQPADDAERTAPVIPFVDSARVVNAAIPVGRALWCGVEWQPYYLAFMQGERRGSWSEKQVAFIGVLFGLN